MEKDDKLSYNVQLHIDLEKNIENYQQTEKVFIALAKKCKSFYKFFRFFFGYFALKFKLKQMEYEKKAIHQEKAVKNLTIQLAYVKDEIEKVYQPQIFKKMAETGIVEKIRTWRKDNPKMLPSDARYTMVQIYTRLQNDKSMRQYEELLGYKSLLNLYEKFILSENQ